jgi:hypothetical protein
VGALVAAFRRSLLIRGTYIAITAPAPEALEAMHWTGGEGVYDMLAALHYVRPTRDGRVAFGGAGYRASGGDADHQQYRFHERSVAMLVRDCAAMAAGVRRRPDRGRVGRADRRLGPVSAVLRHAPGRRHALRPGLHRQRCRPVPPGRQDPVWARARDRGRGDDPADLRRRPQTLPARTAVHARGMDREPVDHPPRRTPGRGGRPGLLTDMLAVFRGAWGSIWDRDAPAPAVSVRGLTKSYGRAVASSTSRSRSSVGRCSGTSAPTARARPPRSERSWTSSAHRRTRVDPRAGLAPRRDRDPPACRVPARRVRSVRASDGARAADVSRIATGRRRRGLDR